MSKDDIIEQMFKGVFGDAVKFVEVPYEPATENERNCQMNIDEFLEKALQQGTSKKVRIVEVPSELLTDQEKHDAECLHCGFNSAHGNACELLKLLRCELETMQELHDQNDDELTKAVMFDAIDQLKEHILELTDAPDIITDLKADLKTHQECLKDSTGTGVLLAKKLKELDDENKDLKHKLKEQIDSNNKIADLIKRSHYTNPTTVRLF